MTDGTSHEEEKQEIEPVALDPDDLADIVTNVAQTLEPEGVEDNHDSDPDVSEEEASDSNQEIPNVPSSKKKGWNKLTLALVFAVVALTAALVIVVSVILTTRDGNDSTAAAIELTSEKQFVGSGAAAGDRQVPTVFNSSVAPFPSIAPVTLTKPPVVNEDAQEEPEDNTDEEEDHDGEDENDSNEEPPSMTPRPSSLYYTSSPYTPRPSGWYPTAPSYASNYPYNNQCSNNGDMGCDGRPCGLTTFGGDELICCPSWAAVEIWTPARGPESYCWGWFALGEQCVDGWDGDNMCQSGICHAGRCDNKRGAVGDVCTDSHDCSNGCGVMDANSTYSVCCENYEWSSWNGSTYVSYCAATLGLGDSCTAGDQCESFICVQRQCAAQLLPAGSVCTAYDECDNYACGLTSIQNRRRLQGSTSVVGLINGTNSSNRVCCPSGGTYSIYNGRNYEEYCYNSIPNGQQCFADELCQSGICINETVTKAVCSDSRLADGETCVSDNHCQNRGCGHSSFPPTNSDTKTCCPNGRYEWLYFDNGEYLQMCARSIPEGQPCDGEQSGDALCKTGICVQSVCSKTRLPAGDDCDGHYDCQSGRCGFAFEASEPKQICCDQTFGLYNDASYEYLEFCVRTVPTGESCAFGLDGSFDMGVLYNDDEENDREGEDGYPYNDDATNTTTGDGPRRLQRNEGVDTSILCASGICIQGVCSEDYLDGGETCGHNFECSSAACAFSSFEFADRERVCCVGDARYYYEAPYYNGEYFCERSVASGGRCPSDENNRDAFRICESGICINGLCTDERQADGDVCQNSNDCDSQACGFDSVDFGAREMICCVSEGTVYVSDGFDYDHYCVRNVPLGGKCISATNGREENYYGSGGGLMCSSGICIDNVCVDSRLEDEEMCNNHGECDSGACGFNSLDFAAREKVCCESICSNQLFDGFGYEDYCVGIQDEGEPCTWDNGREFDIYPQLCSTGICVDEMCTTELLKYNDTCSHGTDCIGGGCGFTSFDMSADKVCCDWTYSIYDGICGHDDFCQSSFTFGQQCSYRGQRYDSLCDSYLCTMGGTCGNETMPCPEDEDGDHAEEDGEGNGDSSPPTNSTAANTSSGNGRTSNSTRRQLEDYGYERPNNEEGKDEDGQAGPDQEEHTPDH
mmetsp:Transcript_1340/g.2185  ORF Transcript_1340/g.2185 Transcript_1340/m.2185 type:complete len:1145 (-) Transcript_1340:63-3497(-)|eukprot:CAMPEP_0119015102 /NCGR_PEP_ID=MMETSP1176-20130426/10558_1 /TAXON_ID=265551 /ORGANISM="Synedropsis recta cf, Strain CCMP1620" /LENGTH=1144 /DNA_ID=CAMNT_0006968369 /DNA_START=149 /DNA_END=3583 /DNA_ORIENTATION=+